MTVLNYFLLSVLYFWCSSTALSLGIGYYTLYRPILSGMIAGLILGDYKLGMMAGTAVNIIYIDFVSTGGSLKGDQCLSAIIAASSAILLKLSPIEAAAIAYPFGFIGILIWKYRLNINTIFVRKYDLKYKKVFNPNIAVYDGVLPQILLYVMSALVIVISVVLMLLLKNFIFKYYLIIKFILLLIGIFLINISIINIILKINNKAGTVIFFIILLLTISFNINSYVYMIILLILLVYLTFSDVKLIKTESIINENKILNKKDLFLSWFIWMNFSHSCYNYERLQGMAFAHSMNNIVKKLYIDKNKVMDTINQYTEFFNTEPNIGTPIHGYIISLEEQKSMGYEIASISSIKNGMMGIAAGLGDSFTQVVLAPIFISLSLMMCLDKKFIGAMIPVIILGAVIIYISYTGWMNGYYIGREYLLKRINQIKNNKIKKYFHLIFSGILGALIGKLIILNCLTFKNNILYICIVTVISVIYIIAIKLKKSRGKA